MDEQAEEWSGEDEIVDDSVFPEDHVAAGIDHARRGRGRPPHPVKAHFTVGSGGDSAVGRLVRTILHAP